MDRNHVFSVLKKHITNAVDDVTESDIDGKRTLSDYGISSMDMVSIISGTMRELKVKIAREGLNELKDINALVDLFVASSQA